MPTKSEIEIDYYELDYYEITEALKRCIESSSAAYELSGFNPESNPDDPDRYVDHFGHERPLSVSVKDWLVFCSVAKVKLADYEEKVIKEFTSITAMLGLNVVKSEAPHSTEDWNNMTSYFEDAYYYAICAGEAEAQEEPEMCEAYGEEMLKPILRLIDHYKLVIRK